MGESSMGSREGDGRSKEYNRETSRERSDDYAESLTHTEIFTENSKLFQEAWTWLEKEIHRVNTLKGWKTVERRDGEFIALIHSEASEVLEAMRNGNPESEKIPPHSSVEEELADLLIRLLDLTYTKKYKNFIEAFFAKLEYNRSRPYRHGGKLI